MSDKILMTGGHGGGPVEGPFLIRDYDGTEVLPAIVPMATGELPAEPGWYVADVTSKYYPDRIIGEFIYLTKETPRLMPGEWFIYSDDAWSIDDPEVTFVARIYPERIKGMEE